MANSYFLRAFAIVFLAFGGINAGTVAASVDIGQQISDGIPLGWKVNGVDYTSADGVKHHLDLKALGASTKHRDLIVWVDWMDASNDPAPHVSHMPIPTAIQEVKDAFAKAPVANPDGTTGINLIVLVSPNPVPHKTVLGAGTESSIWADFDTIKRSHFPKELAGAVHYCLFAHDINTSRKGTSGDSRGIGAYDFIVSLGSWDRGVGNEDEQAGTFFHELGHNLGLQHGGSDSICWKPNYLSVMNYAFQTDGLRVPLGQPRFDYSRFALGDINELDLDETQPLSRDARLIGWSTLYFCPGASQAIDPPVALDAPIDWNCDGNFNTHVSSHISGPDGSPAPTVLRGFDDWANVTLMPQAATAGLTPRIPFSVENELALGQANQVAIPPVRRLTAISADGRVRLSWERLPERRVVGYSVTKTENNGAKSYFTTQQPSFVDKTADSSTRYDVQGLYVPHGFTALTEVKPDQLQEFSIAGEKMGALSMQAIDATRLAELKASAKSLISKISKGYAVDQGQDLDSALKAETSKVVLQTKSVSIEIKGVN